MPVKVGMNGFGRIGRYLLRLMADNQDIQIAAINARADNAALAYLFKYDSTYGTFQGTVDHDENGIIVNGRHIAVTRCKAGEWEWDRLGVTLAVETTGTIKDSEGLAQHLACGAKKVVISAPGKDVDAMIVMGVNHDIYDGAKHNIISAASCTTNCLAPAVKVLHETFGFRHGLMTTIHSYTMSQRILDGTHKDWRRGRAAAVSMVPSSTGAAKAVGKVIPALQGKLTGTSMRIPSADVSIVDLTCRLEKAATYDEICAAVKAAAEGPMAGVVEYVDDEVVSSDFITDPHTSIFDAKAGLALNDHFVKLMAWYDNEWGFSNKMLDLTRHIDSVRKA
mgnify:CR=1 FL=1